MSTVSRFAAALLVAGGFAIAGASCGGASQAPARSSAQSTYASGGASAESSAGSRSMSAPTAEPGTTAAEMPPTNPRPQQAVTSTGAGADSGDRMSYWTGQLDHASSQLSSASDCRDICRASGDICVAAHEICDLTGDGERAAPSDGRCSRARGACEQATRQRNGSCPVCPRE